MSLQESPETIYDGFSTLEGGMDSGRAPILLNPNQTAFMVNATVRSGFVENRPGMFQHSLTGDDPDQGRWQGASIYQGQDGKPYVIASIEGEIIRFDPITNQVTNLTDLSGGLMMQFNAPKVWMVQAEQYLVIQDNLSRALIFDGASLRQSNPKFFGGDEVPTGNAMEYNNGRLWVVLPDFKSFVAGDLAYSVTGTTADLLKFTENEFLNGGGRFVMAANAGTITSLRSVAVQDTTTGQGPLQVFTTLGAASINAPFNREAWQDTQSPIVTVSLMAPGPRSDTCTTNVNGDIWYRANDGVRSFQIARRDHGTWVNTPVSHEMERILDRDDPYLLDRVSMARFDNRLLFTVSPYRAADDGTQYGTVFRGLGVLDFMSVSSMFERTQPVWEGMWTGLRILQILSGTYLDTERCFIFALNDDNEIELWELSKANKFDETDTPIEWFIETRSFGFEDQGNFLKQLQRTERWFDRLAGTVNLNVKYRPDSYWDWKDLDEGSVCANTGVCLLNGCTPPQFPQLQYRPRKLTASPSVTDCESAVQKPFRDGFDFQLKITITGAARLRRFRLVAGKVKENTVGGCLGTQTCVSESGCEESPFSYNLN